MVDNNEVEPNLPTLQRFPQNIYQTHYPDIHNHNMPSAPVLGAPVLDAPVHSAPVLGTPVPIAPAANNQAQVIYIN